MDAVALLGLKQEELYELAPVCPTGEALTAHSYNLWYNAMLQWQQEGTRLFDMVRPTLDLTGPHANQDLRRLRGWKCDDVRDGRALLQWALSFVDRSSVDGQMELLKQIGSMTLDPNETLFGLSEHLFKLWELWLDISSNDRNAPAAFLSQLLTSMPVAPEGPIVHVRRYLAELIRKKDSHLLNDIDGDKGLFANMIDYGRLLGLQDVPRSALNLLGSSAKPAGGPPAGGGKGGDDPQPDASKGDCNKCFAYAWELDDRPSITLERANDGAFLANLINIDATPQWPTDDDGDALSATPTMLHDKNAADALLAAHFDIDDASNPNPSQVAPPPPPPPPPSGPGSTYNLDAARFGQAMTEEGKQAGMLHAHVGEMLTAREVVVDLEDETIISNAALFVVLDNSTVQKIDTKEAHKWHCPNNEREFNQSPQRALWQTAKELKMDEYLKLNMYELVKRSDVNEKKHTIYKTLWAYKIKFEEDGLTFNKLNPRWCVRGGTMDRDMFKSYAEMMRATSMNIGWGLKGEFFKQLIDALLDLGNAFQSTRTVDKDNKQLEGEPEFYTEQAPGFKKYGPNGEELVCKQHCFMQGRIDATAGFDKALTKILVDECGMTSMVWDKKVFIFNTTKLAGTTASLHDIIAEATRVVADGKDSGPQQVPIGWAWFACHVDDLQALATGLHCRVNNRILIFVRGTITVAYACKYTGWHGNKTLGYGVALCEENETVTITAAGALKSIHEKLFSKADFKATPRHIVTEAVYDKHPGEVPLEGDPLRPEYLMRQALVRSVLGACIWASQAYPAIASGINAMCVDMSNPGDARLGQLRHMFMHLGANPPGKTFGGKHVTAVGGDYDDVAPFTPGIKDGRYHFFSDASINVTGGIGMFNGCCIQNYCLRQHLQSPDAHTSELVAAGSNIHAIVPVNGLLQEIGLRRGRPTTTYFDSISTVFVATSDAAPKKSVWLARRTKVVTEAVELDEIKPVHIKEYDMVADSCTKYIKRDTWARHMHYTCSTYPETHPTATATQS